MDALRSDEISKGSQLRQRAVHCPEDMVDARDWVVYGLVHVVGGACVRRPPKGAATNLDAMDVP